MRLITLIIFLFISFSIYAADLPISLLKLPPGFKINVYAYPVPDARSMALGPDNIIFVGTRTEGKVYAIVPDAKEPNGTKVITIAKDLNMPNGVAYADGSLYSLKFIAYYVTIILLLT